MDIGGAIAAIRSGHKCTRAAWGNPDAFIVYMSGLHLPPHNTTDTCRKVNDRTAKWIGEDAPLNSLEYIAMSTGDGDWQPGWVASQADILANDWEVVDGSD